MTKQYNPQKIEKKWQKFWEDNKLHEAKDFAEGEKDYILIEFPYPSGEGLHIGHPRPYTAMDVTARKLRMQGRNVLYPIGWDAFGLPTENYAIKTGIHPAEITKKNIARFTEQVKALGISFDWSREVNTSDPKYYKWTQWIFLQLYKEGLAYKKKTTINWCPSCKIGLANEEAIGGVCERCGTATEKKEKEQWMLAITKYADRLIDDLDETDYLEKIKTQQKNWIGRSEGALITFSISNYQESIEAFTTRADTLFGVTYVVLAPEHKLVKQLQEKITNWEEVQKYITEAKRKSDLERTELAKEKTGVELEGIEAVNPATGEKIPVWIADYALASYGTGAVMAVPAHDERDFEFAKKYKLPVKEVIQGNSKTKKTILLIHGLAGNSKENWFPWLKEEFEKRNYNVLIPNLPNSDNPKLEEWIESLNSLKDQLSGEITVIGHSLGCITACKFIDSNNLKIDKLILVAPTGKSERQWEGVRRGGCDDGQIANINNFNDTEINWGNIKNISREILLYFSDNDPYIPLSIQDDYKELDGKVKIFKDQGHFNDRAGVTKLPELIEDILETYLEDGFLINSKKYELPIKQVIQKKEPQNVHGAAALIKLKNGHFIFQERDDNAKVGANTISFFGGGREKNENLVNSIKRELKEELNIELQDQHISLIDYFAHIKKPNFYSAIFFIDNINKKDIKLAEGRSIVESDLNTILKNKKINIYAKKFLEHYLHTQNKAFEDYGTLVNSDKFSGLNSEEAREKITEWLTKENKGKKSIQFKLRDWVFSRQRYWGEPIPLIFCENCKKLAVSTNNQQPTTNNDELSKGELLNPGWFAVPEENLPVELPYVERYKPTDTGESPLSAITDWVNTKCPTCGGPAKRETDTMPNWAGSSWYFLRYCDPDNDKELADIKKLEYWMPVNWYNGGMEHVTLHLLYSRFWHKFLFDIKTVTTTEPYKKRTAHGMVLATDGKKMSKSLGNVINPDDIIDEYGADSLRLYEMFMGPFDQAIAWDSKALKGIFRFLNKVWQLQEKTHEKDDNEDAKIKSLLHQTIEKVSSDIAEMKFNTAIAVLMTLTNELGTYKLQLKTYETLLKLLCPFAPHMTEEIWHDLGNETSLTQEEWPRHDPKLIKEESFELVILVNGKIRDKVKMESGTSEEEAKKIALNSEKVKQNIEDKEIKKVIFVKGKLINFVV